MRRAAAYFDYQIDGLNKAQLTDYFAQILDRLSWSTLKHDLYGLKFYYAHVLDKSWSEAELTKAPKVSRLPDIVTVAQRQQIINATRVLSYRVLTCSECRKSQSFIQRFSSAANLNIHLHCLVLDGVYRVQNGAVEFHSARSPTAEQ